MAGILSALDVALIICGLYITVSLIGFKFGWRKRSLPPGPRPLPIIGNLLDLPRGVEARHWAKHKKLYGMVMIWQQN